ncbi:MAG TPA: hypothetical protein VGE07_25485 [Herpetosiphonaceae bacterium]
MRKTLLALTAGYFVIAIALLLTFVGLNQAAPDPNAAPLLTIKLMLAIIGGLAGGYAAALVAPPGERPVRLLAALMTLLGIGAIAVLLGGAPLWFQAALIMCSGPAILTGGQVRRWQWLARRG